MRYILLNPILQKRFRLPVDHGAFVLREGMPGRPAVLPNSAAHKAGIKETDVILELNSVAVDEKIGVEDILEKVKIGDTFEVKILREGQEKMLTMTAEERL